MSLVEFSGAVLSSYWYVPGWELGGNLVTVTRRIWRISDKSSKIDSTYLEDFDCVQCG